MNAPKFFGLVLLVAPLASLISGPVGAREGRHTGTARTELVTDFLSRTDNPGEEAAAQPILVASGDFACGPNLTCDATTQYCSIVVGGPKGAPRGYSCVDAPDVSSPPTCERISAVGCECTELNGGGITVTCTAP
jgi:hypothetical protein